MKKIYIYIYIIFGSLSTLARDIGLAKHLSKFMFAKALLHFSACCTPVCVKTDKSELPCMLVQQK